MSCLPVSVLHPHCGAGTAGEAAQCPAASHIWWESPGSRAVHTELMASLPALSTRVLPVAEHGARAHTDPPWLGASDLSMVQGGGSPTSMTTIQKLSAHFPSRPLRPSPNSFNSSLWRTNLCPAQPQGSRLDPSVFPGLLTAVRELHAPPLISLLS